MPPYQNESHNAHQSRHQLLPLQRIVILLRLGREKPLKPVLNDAESKRESNREDKDSDNSCEHNSDHPENRAHLAGKELIYAPRCIDKEVLAWSYFLVFFVFLILTSKTVILVRCSRPMTSKAAVVQMTVIHLHIVIWLLPCGRAERAIQDKGSAVDVISVIGIVVFFESDLTCVHISLNFC